MPADLGPYFAVPKGLIRNGIAGRLGPSGTAVYVALCEHVNRGKDNTCKVSDWALAADTHVSQRLICDIRKRLLELKLVECDRGLGESYTYRLLRLNNDWVKTEDRARVKRRPRALHAARMSIDTQPQAKRNTSKFCYTLPANYARPSRGFC